MAANSTNGIKTLFYCYELYKGSIIRRRLGKARSNVDGAVYLIEVLVNEDESGSYLNSVRGLIVPGRDQNRNGFTPEPCHPRPFKVSIDLMLAIGRHLGVGPRVRSPLRLATLDGRHVK